MLATTVFKLLRAGTPLRSSLRLPLVTDLGESLGVYESSARALVRASELAAHGASVELLPAMPAARTERAAARSADSVRALFEQLQEAGIAEQVGVTLDPAALGLELEGRGQVVCVSHLSELVAAGREAQVRVTVHLSHPRHGEALQSMARQLREREPQVRFALEAHLYRTEEDVRRLRELGGGIRLSRGWSLADETASYQRRVDGDLSYVRCLRLLLDSQVELAVAVPDQRLLRITEGMLLRANGRGVEFLTSVGDAAAKGPRPGADRPTRVALVYGAERLTELEHRLLRRPRLLLDFALDRINRSAIAKD